MNERKLKVIDLTQVIEPSMPVYPGTEPPVFEPANSYEQNGFKETKISMFTHTGTHIDPPAHIFPGRTTLDSFHADQFIGMALVIDCRDIKEGGSITMDRIKKYGEKADKADFLLFCLGWDKRWGTKSYFGDFPCIDDEVLTYIMNGSYKGIGFDVISVDPMYGDCLERHKKLFKSKDIINIENLCNLDQCGDDLFWFSCFPLKIKDCDGAPARAVAWFE